MNAIARGIERLMSAGKKTAPTSLGTKGFSWEKRSPSLSELHGSQLLAAMAESEGTSILRIGDSGFLYVREDGMAIVITDRPTAVKVQLATDTVRMVGTTLAKSHHAKLASPGGRAESTIYGIAAEGQTHEEAAIRAWTMYNRSMKFSCL